MVVVLDVVEGSVAGVELVVVVLDLVPSELGAELVVVVDSVAWAPGVVVVAVVVDFVSSAAKPRASSIIVAMSMATNIFFISKPHICFDLFDLYDNDNLYSPEHFLLCVQDVFRFP